MVIRHSTLSQARFRAKSTGVDWPDFELENSNYEKALESIRSILSEQARVVVIEREFIPTHIFGPEDILICVGQDGLVANCLKYTVGQYVLGINPDPERFDGVLLGWNSHELEQISRDAEFALNANLASRQVAMAEAKLNDGQSLRGVNDIFIGLNNHGSARYEISHAGRRERQSSSGVLVTTGLGTTGWLKSIVSTASAVTSILDGKPAPGARVLKLDWDSPELVFSVREAFPSNWTQANLVFGKVTANQPLEINSEVAEGGVIFSDGMQQDALSFNAPQTVTISLAEVQGRIGWKSDQ